MDKKLFDKFYDDVVSRLGRQYMDIYESVEFAADPDRIYKRYLKQVGQLPDLRQENKTAFGKLRQTARLPYGRSIGILERHFICACMLVVLVEENTLIGKDQKGRAVVVERYLPEQFAFLSTWELLKILISQEKEKECSSYKLPEIYNKNHFTDAIVNVLFLDEQKNTLSAPTVAGIFYLIENYYRAEIEHAERAARADQFTIDGF